MQISTVTPRIATPTAPATPPAPAAAPITGTGTDHVAQSTTWTNPAAAAAMRSTVDLLTYIEDGITRNFQDPERVAAFASDLRSTFDIYGQATDALQNDESKENDSFLPLITKAGENVDNAQDRLAARDFNTTWPIYRNDILAQVRTAKSLSQNVADQLDPRSVFTPA